MKDEQWEEACSVINLLSLPGSPPGSPSHNREACLSSITFNQQKPDRMMSPSRREEINTDEAFENLSFLSDAISLIKDEGELYKSHE